MAYEDIDITLVYSDGNYGGQNTWATVDEIPELIKNTESTGEYDCSSIEIRFDYIEEEERIRRAKVKELERINELIEKAQVLVPKLYGWVDHSVAGTNQVDAIKILLDSAFTSLDEYIEDFESEVR